MLEDMLVTLLVDLTDVGMSTVRKFGASDIKRGINMWADRFPVKLRQIIFINAGAVVMGAYNNLIKPFLPEKFQKRLVVARNLEELHARVPASMIPVELVGAGGSLSEEEWRSWPDAVDALVA